MMETPNSNRKTINRGVIVDSDYSRFVPPDLKKIIMERDNNECVRCGAKDYIEIDHAIPVSMGGNAVEDNLQLLCRKCNMKKRDRQWWGKSLYNKAIEKYGNEENIKLLLKRTGLNDF